MPHEKNETWSFIFPGQLTPAGQILIMRAHIPKINMLPPLFLVTVVVSCAVLLSISVNAVLDLESIPFSRTDMAISFFIILASIMVTPYLIRRDRRAKHAEKAIDSANAGYWVLSTEGVFLDVNPAYCRMVGYSHAQILKMCIADFEAKATQVQIRAQIQRIIQSGQEKFQTRHKKRSGGWVDLEITVTAVGGQVIAFLRDITDQNKAAKVINDLAFFDSLTALPNRLLLQDRMEQALLNATRIGCHGAILFIDIDHFKVLNDTLGHAAGDKFLLQVAQRLTACVREGDTVARSGGDEFVVVLAGLNKCELEAAAEAEVIAKKILASLALTYQLGTTEQHRTASMGITLFRDTTVSIEDLLKQADLALYKSKESGRNALSFFDPAMQATIETRTTLETDLRSALQENQFVLHYQAQVAGEKQQVTGAEVLVRWIHPTRGLVSPAEFIPLAEETGLILPLGQWVLETACRQLSQWATRPERADLILAVNVSAKQLQQVDFVSQVVAVLDRTGANPCRLKLEITESVLISNLESIITKMSALKALGVGFSLDDFGTGYSSLAYLSRLPLNQLKIDRSFVMNIENSDNAVVICAAIISLAHSLRLQVVAEGVETEAQRYFLSTVHRCQFLQGYLISRPVPVEEFEAVVQQSNRA